MGKRARAAAAAHRAQVGVTRESFRDQRQPTAPSPQRDAHHECGHAVLNWLYGVGFVQDPVIELRTDRTWSAHRRDGGERWMYYAAAVTHSTRTTAPGEVGLTRFDLGSLRRLALGMIAGPVAEQRWWSIQGRNVTLRDCGFAPAPDGTIDRSSDFAQAYELCAAAVMMEATLIATQHSTPIGFPRNWFDDLVASKAVEPNRVIDEIARLAVCADRLLAVPLVASAHLACVDRLLPVGALTSADLDEACRPMARLRVPPTEAIAVEGRCDVLTLMDPATYSAADRELLASAEQRRLAAG